MADIAEETCSMIETIVLDFARRCAGSERELALKGEIYYKLVDDNLFTSQSHVDDAVSRICELVCLPRDKLNVFASPKGLVLGNVVYCLRGKWTSVSEDFTSCVPEFTDLTDARSDAKAILAVEKHSVFQHLIDTEFAKQSATRACPVIIVTARGYPDINSRLFVKRLSEILRIPSGLLVDADPHGVDIFLNYRYGPKGFNYESGNAKVADIKWIGLLPSELTDLEIPPQALLAATKADERKAKSVVNRLLTERVPKKYAVEILKIRDLSFKAEIECLKHKDDRFLTDVYLPMKIQQLICGND